ncbi:MAG: carboxypeptidase regulatory-like domain-containing protein, partial [Gemmatimonadota bacterium]
GPARAYAAVDADTLAAAGFVRAARADSVAFFGPDAEVLLSDAFLNTHCFIAVSGRDEARGLVGLSFRPIPGRKLADIAGTLWIEPRTSELRYIEFHYVGLPRALSVARAGGRTDFRRLSNGLWIVDRWYIRTPLVAAQLNDDFSVAALGESGGMIIQTSADSAHTLFQLSGTVRDSVRGLPLAGAQVYLSGTPYSTRTDSLGNYSLGAVPGGTYLVSFWHPTVDSLPYFPTSRRLHLQGASPVQLDLAIPSSKTLVSRACPASPTEGVVSGYVLTDRGAAGGKMVTATLPGTRRFRAISDSAGRYVICGIPPGRNVRITSEGSTVEFRQLDGHSRFVRVDLLPIGSPRELD